MLFNDPVFLFLFLPITALACAVSRYLSGPRGALAALILASAVFYGWWNPTYLILLAVLIGFNFGIARAIKVEVQLARKPRVTTLLTIGVATNLAVLCYFKYTDFLVATTNTLFDSNLSLQHIILPLGISFFTFQKIAYLVDASRGQVEDHDFLDYCFFVMFFPQLIAGPIVHHSEIFSQTKGPTALTVRSPDVMIGCTIFAIGLFKKVVVADSLGSLASPVFSGAAANETLHFFRAWEGTISYGLQIYFDFSGYSDMAIGGARLFGIRLPLNFNSPYQANSIIEFWRRWHMTLSRFLRDYLYIPLGGNRRGPTRRYINLLVTMGIGGLWHGAAWNFAIWGLLHGVYLVINYLWRAVWPPIDNWWSRSIARLLTLLVVTLAWVPFRAPTLAATLSIYRGMLNLPATFPPKFPAMARLMRAVGFSFDGPPISIDHELDVLWLLVWIVALWAVPNTQQFLSRFRPALDYGVSDWNRDPPLLAHVKWCQSLVVWRPNFSFGIFAGLIFVAAVLSLQRISEFLYFQF